MKHLSTIRIFADHYQFWIYDETENPFEPLPDYTEQTTESGWARNDHSIIILTRAHLNDHRLDVFRAEGIPELDSYDRATIHHLEIKSGDLVIYGGAEALKIQLVPDIYSIVVATFNLGNEPAFDDDMLDDEEFFKRLDWERYEIYICDHQNIPEGKLGL